MAKEKFRLKNVKRKLFLFMSIILIVSGIGFSTTNAYQLLKGYLLYKIEKDDKVPVKKESNSSNKVATKENKNKAIKTKTGQVELYPVRPIKGEEIGTLSIPKIEATLPIFHGTDGDELKKGVGHYANSVLPGENDNSVLSGHNDSVFRRLGEVGVGNLLIVRTSAGEFTYKVKKVRIVDANDRTVIVPKPSATLTLTTCYPFNLVGTSPQRYILVAYLLSEELNQ